MTLNARGFEVEENARQFGHNLRLAIELSSVSTRLGVDVGRDLTTFSLGNILKKQIAEETGGVVRNNIHGLDVFEDDPQVVFMSMTATATVRAHFDPFLSLAAALQSDIASISKEARDVILLLNYALNRKESEAQILFAFSAVEMLGQQETWTDSQKAILAQLARFAENSGLGCEQERSEVADACRRGLHKIGLRQGVLRLLDQLNLSHLRSDWDKLYAERSKLVHGLAPRPGVDYSDLAYRSVSLCGQILLTFVSAELPMVNSYVDTFYSIPAVG